jgi:hypothetical protein
MKVLRKKYMLQCRQWKSIFCQTGLTLLYMGLPSVQRQRRLLLLLRSRLAGFAASGNDQCGKVVFESLDFHVKSLTLKVRILQTIKFVLH